MKIKFSKTLAIACILCMTFATLTAFADVTVTTTTTYDFEAAADADMTITTTVAGLENNGEITYYVENEDGIVYIDQATASGKTATFSFVAATDAVLKATAKNGSDKDYTFSTFKFAAGVNFQTNGTPTTSPVAANWAKTTEEAGLVLENGEAALTGGYVFQGQISGQVETEYGVQVVIDQVTYHFPARGCDANGVYVVVIEGIDATAAGTATPYIAAAAVAE